MKTKFYLNLKSWLLMMLMLIGAGGNLWADEVTFTPGTDTGVTSVTKNGVTATMTTMNNASYYQIYANQSATFTISNGTITKIEFTCTAKGTSKYGPGNASADVGSYSYSGQKGTWSGSATTVTISSTAQVRMSSLTITYTPSATGPVDPDVSFASNPLSLEVGETATNAINKPSDLNVTYSSGDANVATVNANGAVTGVAEGNTTITASWAAVANTYNAGSKSYTVNVTAATPSTTYVKVTDANQLVAGNEYVVVSQTSEKSYVMGAPSSDGKYREPIEIDVENNSVAIKNETAVVLTLGGTSGEWTFLASDNNSYLAYPNNSNNQLTSESSVNGNSKWVIGNDLRLQNNANTNYYIEYSSSAKRFSCYKGTSNKAYLYVKEGSPINDKENASVSIDVTELTVGGETAKITAVPESLVMSYESSAPSIASVENGVVTGLGHGSATIIVSWEEQTVGDKTYNAGSREFEISVVDPNRPGTKTNPYTVAQAQEFIETLGSESSEVVYVKGIVSQVDEFVERYSSITYWISDDGTTSSQLECYSGKGLESADFSSVNDIQVGDIVTVAGTLKKYNDIYEFNYNNYLASFERPVYEITAKSNNEDLGTVSLEGNIITATLKDGSRYADPAFTVDAEGEVTVEQDGNEFVVVAKSNCTVTINFEAIPTHKVTWSINGETSEETVAEGAALTHAAPEAIEGKTFVGWTTTPITGEVETATLVAPVMGNADVTYYAVYANVTPGTATSVTDVLNRETTGVTGTSYTGWSGKTATSNAVYAGQSAGGNDAIQLRSDKTPHSGVISTTSGGKLAKVVVVWNSETTNARTLDIYGSNTAYEDADDLYDSSKQGTKLGSIVKGTSTELIINGDYQYVGLRSASGAMYLNSISITWEGGTPATYSGYCTTVDVPIRISTVEELKAFRDAVNTADKTVTSKNVLLVADLDLSGEENWTPIGNLVAYSGQSFDGVFDGNGHTIKNVTVVDNTPNHAVAGLFGSVVNGTIKNLTVENVNLTSSHYAGGIVAYTSNGPTIENCHVIGGTITSVPELVDNAYDNGDKVGGIMGYATAGSTINNCTVDGLTIKAYRDMGGIVGFSAGNVTNNTVKNTTIIQSDVNAYKNEEITTYDYIVGRNGGATLENNVYEELNNVLTIDGAVAKIGDKLYRKLQAAVDAATEEDNVVTLLSDIDLASEYVNINKAVTIKGEGYTITSTAAQAILLTGEGDFALENTNVVASKGHGIQAGNDNTAYAGTLAMEGSTLTVAKRGIRVYKEDTGFGIDINNSTIQSTKEDPTTTYTTGNDAMALSLGATDGKGYEVNVTNSTLQGFSYLLNVVTSGSNLTVNMTGGKTYGRAAVNNWGSNNTITLDGVEVHGLNNQTGPTEAFACVVDNEGAQNNTFVLKDCQFTGTLSEAALAAEGSTASEHLLQLDGMNAIVKVLGSTTYSCNSDDKSRGGIFYTESYLNNNKLYFDDTTKQTFANAFELSVIADEKEAEVDLYPVSFEPEVLYYWAVEGGYDGGYYSFADPFKNGWLADGEFIALQKDITLTEDITCQLASGTSFNFLLGDFTADKNGHSVALNTGVTVLTDKQTDIFKAAEAGYVIVETETETGYSYTAEEVMLAQPIIFHDDGEYEGELTVAIAGEGVKYTLNGGAEQTYSAPFTISDEGEYIIKAWAEKDGIKSSEVSRTFTIVAKQAGAEVADGYYNIKTNDGKFVNVAGRKTVTLVSDTEGKAGTVIRVNADAEGVKVLRSQGVDLPGYAKKAMNYVPEIVQLAVDKLHAEGAGELLGETGLEKIMDKFNESFDYNLYLEKDGEAYRIYGRTPSMKPVVDFYAENKANVDAKLPELEEFINKAIDKVLEKTGGRGQSILVDFDLHNVWQNMDSTLTEPTDEASTMKFYEEVLTSEANVWNFAYQTAMIYWGNLKSHPRFAEIQNNLGDYSKYIDKVENIRPNFRYYIVPSASGVDFISQGNSKITDASTAWTMEPVSEFKVEIPETNKVGDKYYTTLYTDFAYTLPEGVKAMKVTSIGESGCYGYAETKEIDAQSIAEQTPILLVSETAGSKALELSKTGSAVTDNLLKGPDYLISEYKIKTPQVESLFDMAKSILGESAYNEYLSKYEHLMLKNAGTVGNKYFFGLSKDECKEVDVNVCVLENVAEFGTIFASDKENINANKAFLVSDIYTEIRLMKAGDVNRDGKISIADVTALVNIILGKVTEEKNPDNFDFGAADVNCDTKRTIADVTALVNIILGKPNN